MQSRVRLFVLASGVVMLVAGVVATLAGGPGYLGGVAAVGLVVVAFTAPRFRDGDDDEPGGPGWDSAGPSI